MKKIGIFSHTDAIWDDNVIKTFGIGGSETWAIETASFLSHNGYDVTVYGNPLKSYVSDEGVKYKYYANYTNEYFDIALVSRICEIVDNVNSKNIFCLSHDNDLWELTEERYEKVKGIGVLSQWHKEHLMEKMPFLEDEKIFYFSNGYNIELYNNETTVKENSMVWSSNPLRNFDFISDKVFLKVKKEIPDFKIYTCFYGDEIFDHMLKEDIINMERLSKKELSDLQKKCKIWIYPNLDRNSDGTKVFDTFCITALENAMAGNAIVTNDGGGLSTTLEGYGYLLKYDDISKMSEDEYADVLSEMTIKFLKDANEFSKAVDSAQKVCKEKTWETAGKSLLNTIESMTREYYTFRGKRLCLIDENDKDKVILVAVARWEGRNAIDWVEHYKKLGFDKIYIGDNNDIGDDSLGEMLQKYVEDGFVNILDIRGEKIFQIDFYSMFSLLGNYKWCGFFDIDEYLELNAFDNIKRFLSYRNGEDYICFNWVNYGNNEQIFKSDESYEKLFPYPLPLNCFFNLGVKTIINGNFKKKMIVHIPEGCGEMQNFYSYKDGYIKHYKFRSIEGQMESIRRGDACSEKPYDKNGLRFFDNVYHENVLKRKYEGWTFDAFTKLEVGDERVIWIKTESIYALISSSINLMLKTTGKIFFLDIKRELPDFVFNLFFEFALHTGNKVSIYLPELKDDYQYMRYEI